MPTRWQNICSRSMANIFLEMKTILCPIPKRSYQSMWRWPKTGLQLVATNNVHYLQQEDAHAHEVLLCIGEGKTVNDPSRSQLPNDSFILKCRGNVETFAELPEAVTNTILIAERLRSSYLYRFKSYASNISDSQRFRMFHGERIFSQGHLRWF